MPTIMRTNRLLLREVEKQDLDALSKIYADHVCMKFYPSTKSSSEIRTWFQELSFDSYLKHGFGLWAVVDPSSGQVIGDCGITLQETPEGTEPEIGIICGVASGGTALLLRLRQLVGAMR